MNGGVRTLKQSPHKSRQNYRWGKGLQVKVPSPLQRIREEEEELRRAGRQWCGPSGHTQASQQAPNVLLALFPTPCSVVMRVGRFKLSVMEIFTNQGFRCPPETQLLNVHQHAECVCMC